MDAPGLDSFVSHATWPFRRAWLASSARARASASVWPESRIAWQTSKSATAPTTKENFMGLPQTSRWANESFTTSPNVAPALTPANICAWVLVDGTFIVSVLETRSLAVRHPDILHKGSMLQEPATLALLHVEPVDNAAFVGKHLLEIPD